MKRNYRTMMSIQDTLSRLTTSRPDFTLMIFISYNAMNKLKNNHHTIYYKIEQNLNHH
jgi:hypothetical protein